MSQSLLPELAMRVNERVARAQATGRVPSLIVGVVRDASLVHVTATGELPRPDVDLQYRIGSITKTLTAVLVMQLRDEGKLELDDLLYRHLPGTPLGGVSLRQMLAHVAGLQMEPDGEWWERAPGGDGRKLLAGLTPEKLCHPPYRRFHYSNLAYGLLGAVLEQVTGQRWWELVSERILEPLRLRRTTYAPHEPFARGYVVHPWHGTLREEPRYDAGAMAPAGQLWSTAADLAVWASFLTGPDPGVLSPVTLDEMCAAVALVDAESWRYGQGLGVALARRGERVFVGHGGSMPGYLAMLAVHRPTRVGVVCFTNAYTLHGDRIDELAHDVLEFVVETEPVRYQTWRPGAAPPERIEPLTGRWWWMGREIAVSWDGTAEELLVEPPGQVGQQWRFGEEDTDRWRCRTGPFAGEMLLVRRGAGGTVTALDLAARLLSRDPWPAR